MENIYIYVFSYHLISISVCIMSTAMAYARTESFSEKKAQAFQLKKGTKKISKRERL